MRRREREKLSPFDTPQASWNKRDVFIVSLFALVLAVMS